MSTSTNAPAPSTDREPGPSVVDAIFDAAYAWAEVGLSHAKVALESTARAMKKTADALDSVRERLRPES